MRKTICWTLVALTLLGSASAADKQQRFHRNNRGSTTYRERTRIPHSDYDPTKVPASTRATDKELKQIETKVNRATVPSKAPKAALPVSSLSPKASGRSVPMNFQYKAPKHFTGATQSRGKSAAPGMRRIR